MADDPARVKFGENAIGRTTSGDGAKLSKHPVSVQEGDAESLYSEKNTGVRESDFKQQQV